MIFYWKNVLSESFNPSKRTRAVTNKVFANLEGAKMIRLITLALCLLLSLTLAQGSITGTITASEVSGLVVIACYADAEVGCNEALSSSTQIETSGISASYTLENLSVGQYIIFLWRDSNNNGELEENQDLVHYYATGTEEVTLVSPPAQNINFALTSAANPLTTTPTNPASQSLVGSWSSYGYLGNYLSGNKTAKLDLASSVARSFIFNADGTYTSFIYDENYDDVTDGYGPCVWTRVQGIYQTQDNVLVTEIRSEENAVCGLELKTVEIIKPFESFIWRSEENGIGILDVSELANIDDTAWLSGYAYHVTSDAASSTPSTNPLTNSAVSNNPDLIGSWSTTNYFGDYVDANTGAYAGDSQTAHGITLNADGTYNMIDYYDIDFNCKWFRLQGTYQVQADKIILQTQNYEISECGKTFVAQPNETREYLWRFMQYDDGVKLELLPLSSYRDDKDWFYANRYSRVTGEE
jgi:hypothetical protein